MNALDHFQLVTLLTKVTLNLRSITTLDNIDKIKDISDDMLEVVGILKADSQQEGQ